MDKTQEQNWQTHKNDELDRALDAALGQYSAIVPRTGLEDRILTTLRAEQVHAHDRAWWRWSVAACATVVFVIIGLAWTSIRRAPMDANRPPAMKLHELPAPQTASTRPPAPDSTVKAASHRSKPAPPAYPKLDQFPSPQPLSAQEKILASYVETYPERAVLLARARIEELYRDQIEEMQLTDPDDRVTTSEDRNNETTER